MFKKAFVFSLAIICSAAAFAFDYSTEWKAAYKLYRGRKYAEAMKAFSELAEKTSNPDYQYNCYRYAGYSARHSKKYDEAIAFADKIGTIKNKYEFYSKIRKMENMYYGKKYKEITEMFPVDQIMTWPKYYRSEGLYYLGLALYNSKNGAEAEKVFKACFDNATSDYWKGLANLRHGYNYRYRLRKPEVAVESFYAVIELPRSASGHKSEAYSAVASILMSQKKNDEALAEYDKLINMKKVSAYWKSRGLYYKGNLLKNMGKKEEAAKCYKDAIAVKGCAGWVKKGCQKQLKSLEAQSAAK
jgi:tetratricopeptide (TPR) repeat protein